MNPGSLTIARARIADCLQLDELGRLVQRHDHLNLSGLGLTDEELTTPFVSPERGLPEVSLSSLAYLRYLDLTGNQLTAFPECVTGFGGLVWLGLNFNRIEKVPESIRRLTNLERLYLRGNALTELPAGVGKLGALVELDGYGNRITHPPVSLLPLLEEERAGGPLYFDLADNGSEWSAIVSAADGADAQRVALANYLRQVGAGSEILAQGKLLLVGEGGVGKTTLLDVLAGEPYNDHTDTTHGLELRPLAFTAQDGWEGTLHAWDFSGQPAMRQTHQLFFTSPALYLLVWNHREAREAETGAEIVEWLTLIDQRTQGEGRVLLIAKKGKDRSAEPPEFAEMLLRFGPASNEGRGGVLLQDACLKVDSEGPEAAAQVRALRGAIASFARNAPAFNERRPRTWIEAQQHFQRLRDGKRPPMESVAPARETPTSETNRLAPKHFLEWSEFAAECRKPIGTVDAEEYARAQHRLGTLVWVDTERLRHAELRDGERAGQFVVLNPDWLSKAIGFVIERDEKDRGRPGAAVPESPPNVTAGLVSAGQMEAIWSAPPQPREGPPLNFPKDLFPFFRQLMRAYDIARPVRHEGTMDGGWHLVPNRLPKVQPLAWKDQWRSDLPQVFWRVELRVANGDPLNHWLGLAIFYRLMIMLHGDALGRQDFTHAAHWRRGFMLAPPGGGLARIEYNGSDRRDATRCVGFDIQVAAHQPREVWAVFAGALNHLIHDLEHHYGYTSIVVKRLVSCPVSLCERAAALRCYFDEAFIVRRAQSGGAGWREQTTICNACDCGKDLPVGLLWDGRASDEPGRFDRIEGKIDRLIDDVGNLGEEVSKSSSDLSRLSTELADIHHRLVADALASPDAVKSILSGQKQLATGLRKDMERVREEMTSYLTEYHRNLADPASDLPRFYTLRPEDGWMLAFFGRKWRLRLHCEKTGYPATLFRSDQHGEFIVSESKEFLRKVAPYVKRVSTILAALGPVAALLTTADPVIAVTPAVLLALAQWAREYQTPVSELASMLEEESAGGHEGMSATGERAAFAEREALLRLHNFLRQDPSRLNKLGLMPKIDGQGRRWWVLPDVEV